MDIDLTDYDQVDEAKFFMSQKLDLNYQHPNGSQLLVTLSSSDEPLNGDETSENDFVFLSSPNIYGKANTSTDNQLVARDSNRHEVSDQPGVRGTVKAQEQKKVSVTSVGPTATRPQSTADNTDKAVAQTSVSSLNQTQRASHPLMTINSNGGKNPFQNLHQLSPDSASSQAYQPFWMRADNFANKPIGLLDVNSSNSCSPSQLSDLLHQIVTKSDSIYIAVPCAFCHEPKACPPSDISAWLNHMNRAHNCKVCPICNKLVGLGPMRDIEIMKKHVVDHIDEDWLERRTVKTSFSFGLQQQWFSGGCCSVKDPRAVRSLSRN